MLPEDTKGELSISCCHMLHRVLSRLFVFSVAHAAAVLFAA